MADAADGPVWFRVFGRPAVLHDGRDAMPGPQDHAAVLAVLVLHRNTPVRQAFLVDAVWGRYPPPSTGRYVHELMSELTAAVASAADGRVGVRAADSADGPGWVLHVPAGRTDLDAFDDAVRRAQDAVTDGRTEDAVRAYADAAALTRSQALSGVKGRWLGDRRVELEERVLRVWVARTDLLVDAWDPRAPDVAADLVRRFGSVPACWERRVAALLRAGARRQARSVLQEASERFGLFSRDPRTAGLTRLRDAAAAGRVFPHGDLPSSDGLPALRATPPPAPVVRYEVLRRVAVTVDGVRLRLDDGQRRLLAVLLLRHPDPVPPALVEEVLAAGGARDRAFTALVGKSLGDALSRSGRRAPVLRLTPAGWVLRVPPGSFDLADVRASVATDDLDAALATMPPDPLADLDGPWFASVRDGLTTWRWTLVGLRAARHLAAGRPAEAVDDLRALCRRSPHDEALHADLIGALHAAGRPDEAETVFDEHAAALARDLGTSPGPALQMLRRRLTGGG